MIYELRTYEPAPGAMPQLISRCRDHTLSVFEKHGLGVAGIRDVAVRDMPSLVCILRLSDLAARDAA